MRGSARGGKKKTAVLWRQRWLNADKKMSSARDALRILALANLPRVLPSSKVFVMALFEESLKSKLR